MRTPDDEIHPKQEGAPQRASEMYRPPRPKPGDENYNDWVTFANGVRAAGLGGRA